MSRSPALSSTLGVLACRAVQPQSPRAVLASRQFGYRHVRQRLLHSSSSNQSAVSDTIDDMVEKFKQSVKESHSEQYEGVAERGLRMLVFGKPGSGKGTLSARLVKDYDISFVSTGDVLRKEIAAKSEVGRKAEEVVASGGLVSDELMLEVVKAELDRLRGKSWIIDGFPRTLHQGELLDAELNKENRPLNMIVHLNVPDSVIMARIAARWVHLPSGRVYNTTYSAPKVPGIDDVTGEPLSKRPDDTPETFTKRLSAYYESTAPLLQYFSQIYPESLFSISGSSSDELWPQLQALIEPYGLRRKDPVLEEKQRREEEIENVRKEADDLRDAVEEAQTEQRNKKGQ